MSSETSKFESRFFRYAMSACAVAMLIAIGMYAYLGTFSRYLADDYCEAVRVIESSPIAAVVERYTAENWPRATIRFSNLLFVGFSEQLGKNNMPITIFSMIFLWAAGLIWSVRELRKFLKIDWYFQTDLFVGAALGFFSLLQAPNLFQTIYWRSAMMTHFAPLVFGSFIFAFWVKQARRSENQPLPLPIYIFFFFTAFIVSGFSEPPTTTLITTLSLLMFITWVWGKSPAKQKYLALQAWTFTGAFLGLMVMILSPASANAAQEKTLNIVEILGNSFFYSYLFIADTLNTQPLPIVLTVLIPFMALWLHTKGKNFELLREQKRFAWVVIVIIPFLVWLLIAAGFSPSVYGQGFPVERMRFLARFLMISAFILEGSLFGLLLKNSRFKSNQILGQWAVVVLFVVISVVYPLRIALNLYRYDLPEFSERANLWDLRENYILRHASLGEKELVVPGFSGVYHVKELDSNPGHWVNICAARYYGVDSIRSITVTDEDMLEYLSE